MFFAETRVTIGFAAMERNLKSPNRLLLTTPITKLLGLRLSESNLPELGESDLQAGGF